MKRRDFLGQAAATATLLGVGSVRSQASNVRAAIVIGVNKAGNLPVLHAAVSGAEQIATWLTSQHFDVTTFLDSAKPVRVSEIFEKINEIVDKSIYEQLVVYFAGHGCVISYSERWLLSGAPVNPNEAINVIQSVYLARQSGITNVVLISDACRSAPDTIQAGNVIGGAIFPNSASHPSARTFVDEFYAAHPGEAALELSVDKSTRNYQGIYTTVFLDAFQHPTAEMIATVDGVMVVPNRRLDAYLMSEVSKRAASISLELSQMPESLVQSPDQTYIGRLADTASTIGSLSPLPKTIKDLASFSIRQALN
jgi:Caspase domain